MAIDYSKPSKEVLVQKINQDNSTTFTVDQLDFGPPVVIEPVLNRNTRIVLLARANSGFTGTTAVTYRRRLASKWETQVNKVFSANGATHIAELLPQINLAFGTGLVAAEIEDGPLPLFQGLTPSGTLPFVVKIKPECLMYVGQATLQLRRADIGLTQVLLNADLGVLPQEI